MSSPKLNSMEAALGSILNDHFDNSHNPHETIYRIWLLFNIGPLANAWLEAPAVTDDSASSFDLARPTYN